jgi:flagellar hook-basal body complex protein FliE
MPSPIQPISGAPAVEAVRASSTPRAGGFQDVLSGAMRDVEALHKSAQQTVERFLSGEGEELHTAILATQRADLTFELFLQARNKAVQAYQEIMRMQM